MVWRGNQFLLPRGKGSRVWGVVLLCWVLFMFATPKVSHRPKFHLYADMRNFLGVPNTLNVNTNFPFLIVGVLGFVLCLHGNLLLISLKGEIWGWALFYTGIASVAFGSAYYHLRPDDDRLVWDTLPMMITYSSLFSCVLVERVGTRTGLTCLIGLLLLAILSVAYERTFDDLRLCMVFQLIPSVVIPCMCAALTDRKLYKLTRYSISGHSLEHLISAMFPVLLTLMLLFRNFKFPRLGEVKEPRP
ncbi:hypothetical protein RJ641_022415 [Dillenia turbinata]|uniref:Ceramidase n=1 Tax=Dillenia turbinata TaxID=194707 RepID=A0AAN8UHG7_9MAGN